MQVDLWDPGRLIASLGFCHAQVTVLMLLMRAVRPFPLQCMCRLSATLSL